MIKNAEKFKAEDELNRAKIDAKNELEQFIYNVKSTMDEANLKDKFEPSDKDMLTKKCTELEQWF